MRQQRPFICPMTEAQCMDSGCKKDRCLAQENEDSRRKDAEAPAALKAHFRKQLDDL
jgi:hypothetical protein